MIIKKFKSTLLLILACTNHLAIAGNMGAELNLDSYDGFYLGADLGVSNLIDKETHLISPETQHLGSLGIVGGGFVGYDYTAMDRIKLGFEGFINANGLNAAIRHYNTYNAYTVNSRYNAGFRMLPGFEFNPGTIFHLILGYSNARFHIQDNGTYGSVNTVFNKSGFQSGLGWTGVIFPHLSVRIDTLYTTYASASNTGSGLTGVSQFQYYQDVFSTLEGDLSLVYKFN